MTMDKSEEKQYYTVDMSELINWIDENYKTNSNELDLKGREKIRIDEERDFFVTRLNMTYDLETKKIENFSFDGYILEK